MKLRYLQIASSICITCCHLGMSHPALASQTYSKMLTKEYVVTKKNVNGTIVDKDGNPLIGVTIFEKGTDNGCITDFNGQYQLSLSNRDAVIVISYVGYKTQELKGDQLVEKIVLEEDAVALDELVVVGYAVQKKKELTGSTSSLKASDKKLSVTTSLDQMMQGNLSGVNITNASGMPGGAVRVSIRGVGSINGSNEPLFVIDGIPVSNSDNSGVNGRFGGSVQNPLSMLNPNDIESIDVLKDAAATAIYGSRATNGVVMVTTKRGKKGQRTTVNLSASYGLQSLPKEIEMADSDLYLTVRNEAVNNYNTQNNLKPGDNLYKTLEVNPRPGQPDTDWIDLITHDQAAVQNYEVSVSSGSEKTRFYSSLGYFDQEGIILTNRFRRYSLRTNVDHDISNAFQTGVSIALSKTINNRVPNDNVGNGIFTRSIEQRPFDVPFKEDGRYMIGGVDIPRHNGIQVLNEQKSKNEWYRVLANAYLTIKLLEGLEYKLSLSGDIRYSNDYLKLTKDHPYGSPKGEITDYRSMMQNYLIDNTLTYTKQIKDFNFTALGGYSMQEINTDASSIVGKDFPSSQFDYINAAGRINSASTTGGKNRLISTFFRLNMGYADRYLFTFSIRADGSSKFADGNQWGTFPSVSGAWRISNESFFPKDGIISDLKLRASWGKLGNDKIAASAGFASIQNVQSVFGPNTAIDGFINTTNFSWLGWEVVNETNVGVNFSTLKNRLNADIDWYYRLTDNAVISPKLPMSGELLAGNNGQILNTGIDLSLNWNDKIGQDFNYNIGVNLSYLHNEVKSLKGNMKIIKGGKTVNMVGETMNSFYGYKVIGIYQTPEQCAADPIAVANGLEPGDFIYEDVNGDHVIDGNDKQVLGSYVPSFTYGFNAGFSYKNFDFSLTTYGQAGGELWNRKRALRYAADYYNFDRAQYENRWTGAGSTNEHPSAKALLKTWNKSDSNNASYFVESSDYFRIQNITLGYSFKNLKIGSYVMPGLRLSLTADRPFTTFKANSFTPEVSDAEGWDTEVYPLTSTYTFGVQIDF